jgi:hypothetical protein
MKSRYFFALAVMSIVVAGGLIGYNRHHLGGMVDAVIAKDAAATDTTADVVAIQSYVRHHMGTSATVELKGSYNRAQAAAVAAANPASNGTIYSDAQTACASKADSIVQARCVQNYLATHSQPSANPQAVVQPNLSDYTKIFKGPTFSFDTVGIALLAAVGFVIAGLFLYARPQSHYRGPQ